MTNIEKCMGRETLFAYAHHLLEPDAERELRTHLGECATCRAVAAEYQSLDTLLDEWKPAAPSAWFDARVRAAVAADRTPHWTLFGFRWAQLLAMACLLVLVTAASLIISRRQPSNTQEGAAKSSAAKVEEELTLYKDLPVLEDEDYDMLANFDVLSALPRGEAKVEN